MFGSEKMNERTRNFIRARAVLFGHTPDVSVSSVSAKITLLPPAGSDQTPITIDGTGITPGTVSAVHRQRFRY
jgi:hypothetical protein